ncbi:hypothetical protein NQ036_03515 [Brevibacterium sp. 91QC2O2]|uniref:hypothetical protein n=1 Tax=Brevibacterium sp. 91QC2O2 TaxID=2968458 RepID=UPI00211CB334|nr:hypothetical protein [Brevibacterium sp. 91QC2O2]MCQ9367315.1 hypothetical protein [Brevibacterium sp. 91QC2O2]
MNASVNHGCVQSEVTVWHDGEPGAEGTQAFVSVTGVQFDNGQFDDWTAVFTPSSFRAFADQVVAVADQLDGLGVTAVSRERDMLRAEEWAPRLTGPTPAAESEEEQITDGKLFVTMWSATEWCVVRWRAESTDEEGTDYTTETVARGYASEERARAALVALELAESSRPDDTTAATPGTLE